MSPYSLILAMREPYLSKLLTGEKTAEVRRTSPDLLNLRGMRLYLYHKGRICGHVTVSDFQRTKYQFLDKLCEEVHGDACLSYEEMSDYLYGYQSLSGVDIACRNGIIYKVSDPVRYECPVPVPCRPQSWQYMTDEIRTMLPDGKEKADGR